MGSDFTVIIEEPRHFGDDRREKLPGTFVGREQEVSFACPGVDPDEPALLLFHSLDVDHPLNLIAINGLALEWPFIGIPVNRSRKIWAANVMLVTRSGILQEDNVLTVQARAKRPLRRKS